MTDSSIPNLDALPRRVDRRDAADLVSRHFFKISHRTLEGAPLTWRRVNGRALVEVSELFEWAQRKLNAAPPIRGGRIPKPMLDNRNAA